MKYYAIAIATIMICGIAGLSSNSNQAIAEEKLTLPVETKEEKVIQVEYIVFDPFYITAVPGKNEG